MVEVNSAADGGGAVISGAGAPALASRAQRGNSPAARAALLAFVLSPLVILALLCVLIWLSLRSGPVMHEPPRGAGAGQTGMYNQHMGGGGRAPAE